MIDVKNLTKRFGKHLVLDDISEHILNREKKSLLSGPPVPANPRFCAA